MKNKIQFSEYQQNVHLPSHNVMDGDKANFTGWGVIRQSPETSPRQLQMIKMNLITDEKCRQKMAEADEMIIYKTQVFALRARRIDACTGDSGGPLVVNGEEVAIVLPGRTERCAIGSPDVCTNVYAFKYFIESVVNRS